MSYNTVLFAVEDGIATLTFNRPERLNALNAETMAEIAAVLEGFAMDKDGQESDIVLMIKSLALAGSEFHHT